MQVQLLDKMGTDLSVVNAARVSYSKTKDVFDEMFNQQSKVELHNTQYTKIGEAGSSSDKIKDYR